MFLKEKSDGTIKGRGCADRRKHRRFIEKDSASSPTISTEALFLIATIAAKESRKAATVDIPGAYLQTDLQNEKVIVKFEGKMGELLELIDPKMYRKIIIIEKGKKVLYAELSKVLYGILRGALLFWEKVSAQLVEWGFCINPYDWCVSNKNVEYERTDSNDKPVRGTDGKKNIHTTQMTLGWHVDDFIITHKSEHAIDEIVSKLNDLYRKIAPLKVQIGDFQEYLGMVLDFSKPGKVMIQMNKYFNDLLEKAPAEFSSEAATPATSRLFDVDSDAGCQGFEQSATFHHLVQKPCPCAREHDQTPS